MPGSRPFRYRDIALAALREAGFDQASAEALMQFDADNFLYVRRVMKGDIPHSLLTELATDLETTQFHALAAIVRIRQGHGRPGPEEPTVGLLAEEMAVDPSRASRIASDLVERGYLKRGVSQADGRRSVLQLTEKADALFEAFHRTKWRRTMRLFRDWPREDIVAFARLFARYRDGMAEQYPPGDPVGASGAEAGTTAGSGR